MIKPKYKLGDIVVFRVSDGTARKEYFQATIKSACFKEGCAEWLYGVSTNEPELLAECYIQCKL